ncbi:MAG: hypothetical protein EOP00_02665 [Pedobacter sp.]|nr:MAG: hypothetical protein EOP00_02665 [Pedobacter sp.]
MKQYLQKILPRLKQFSEDLSRKEIFIDKSWVLIDEESELHRYIFKRDGQLIMSKNGIVQVGKWEYLTEAKSLLIDRNVDKILLNQDFFDSAVMLLKKDGDSNFFILANDSIIKDLDVVSYMKQLYRTKNNVFTLELETGNELELLGSNRAFIGMKVFIEGESAQTNIYTNKSGAFKYYVENGQIVKIIERTIYKTKQGSLIIEQERDKVAKEGNLAFIHEEKAEGKFNIGLFTKAHIENGVIRKISAF